MEFETKRVSAAASPFSLLFLLDFILPKDGTRFFHPGAGVGTGPHWEQVGKLREWVVYTPTVKEKKQTFAPTKAYLKDFLCRLTQASLILRAEGDLHPLTFAAIMRDWIV